MSNSHVLVLNCGSSSLKFAIIDGIYGDEILTGLAECLGQDDARIKWQLNDGKQSSSLSSPRTHQVALEQLVKIIDENGLSDKLSSVGHRVVHGGEKFTTSALITDDVLATIQDMSKLAPLHNPANLTGIDAAIKAFPSLPQVAVFDTAFHQSMPEHAFLYAIPYKLYRENGLRRYGFHGTSHYYVTQQAALMLEKPVDQTNLITAHLGNGCSITAVKNGQSVDTSMGLTPLEGLVMGTRSGDVDPGLIHYLNSQLNYTSDDIDVLLNKQSGLLGISELSNDCRTLVEQAEQGNKQAKLALDVFCYRIAKYIASYFVALDSFDALVFTGGVGENAENLRAQVLKHLSILGFSVNDDANLAARFGQSGCITQGERKAFVIPTNEELVIAQDAMKISQQESV